MNKIGQRFLANENFPLGSVYLLRQTGYDVVAIILDSLAAKDFEAPSRAVDNHHNQDERDVARTKTNPDTRLKTRMRRPCSQ
ncbi:MAG: hypothetical protein ONB05_09650, partial [candidate division KSB1 bacterium]|nr:hypothetical protein [candidate division KSB1 bacterium]